MTRPIAPMGDLPPFGTLEYFQVLKARAEATHRPTQALKSFPPDGTAHRNWLRSQAQGKNDKLSPMVPFPVPIVTSRDGVEKEAPSVVLRLQGRAEAAGWTVVRRYARGCTPHATTGRPGPARDSFALVMAHPDGRRACAVYMGQSKGFKWESMWALSSAATRRCPTQGALIFTLITGVPLPDGMDFAESVMSVRRGPEMIRLAEGAVWADWLGAEHGPPVA